MVTSQSPLPDRAQTKTTDVIRIILLKTTAYVFQQYCFETTSLQNSD